MLTQKHYKSRVIKINAQQILNQCLQKQIRLLKCNNQNAKYRNMEANMCNYNTDAKPISLNINNYPSTRNYLRVFEKNVLPTRI